jgi:RNA polymerase sigma-70 factor (ECF subfamily)
LRLASTPDSGENEKENLRFVASARRTPVRAQDEYNRELLLRSQQGDREALGELLEQQREWLHRLAGGLLDVRLRGRLDASDLVQQTCLSVHKQIHQFEGADPAQSAAWLRQIHEHNVRNANREQLQAARRDAGKDQPLAGFEVAATSAETPSQMVSREEEASRLVSVLDRLPPDEREALRLRYIEGLTLNDSAAALQLSREALIWRIQCGLRTARGILGADGDS